MFEHDINSRATTGEYGFNGVINAIANPANEPKRASLPYRPPPETDTLNVPGDNHVDGTFGHPLFEFHDDFIDRQCGACYRVDGGNDQVFLSA